MRIHIDLLDGDPKNRDMDPNWLWGSINVNCGDLQREIVYCGEDEIQLIGRLIYLCASYLEGVKELQKVDFFNTVPGDAPDTQKLFN